MGWKEEGEDRANLLLCLRDGLKRGSNTDKWS